MHSFEGKRLYNKYMLNDLKLKEKMVSEIFFVAFGDTISQLPIYLFLIFKENCLKFQALNFYDLIQ